MGKLTFFTAIKKAVEKVTAKLWTKNAVTFLIFFILATLFWLMQAIGTKKDLTIDIPVKYKGIPNNFIIYNDLAPHISVTIKDDGRELLSYYWFGRPDSLVIDLSDKFKPNGGTISFPVKQLRNEIYATLPKSAQISSFIPEFIQINYDQLAEKTLPVQLQGSYSLAPQYILSDSISIIPAKVKVFGAQIVLDSLTHVNAKPFDKPNLTSNTTFSENLEPINTVVFEQEKVDITIPVEITTEKSMEISITPINFPKGITLRTFPATVTATFSIGISKFSNVNAKDIFVSLDYNEIIKKSCIKYPLQVNSTNPDIRNLRISPSEVETLLEKDE